MDKKHEIKLSLGGTTQEAMCDGKPYHEVEVEFLDKGAIYISEVTDYEPHAIYLYPDQVERLRAVLALDISKNMKIADKKV